MITIDIHIDCAPTLRLQESLGKDVFKILGQEYRNPDFTFFEGWTWENIQTTKEIQKKIREFLTNAYNKNLVRAASWAEVE